MSWNVEMKIRWKVEQVGVAASIYMRISQSCEKIVKSICQDYLGHFGPVSGKMLSFRYPSLREKDLDGARMTICSIARVFV
jgi:hypothetical protein